METETPAPGAGMNDLNYWQFFTATAPLEAWEYQFLADWLAWEDRTRYVCSIPEGMENTLARWRANYEVPYPVIRYALEVAFNTLRAVQGDYVGRYFCAVVWNAIREAATRGWGTDGLPRF